VAFDCRARLTRRAAQSFFDTFAARTVRIAFSISASNADGAIASNLLRTSAIVSPRNRDFDASSTNFERSLRF
jgi:hypothetical protein